MNTTTAATILAKSKGSSTATLFTHDQVHDAAQELGAAGGAVGCPARADSLSARKRKEIARHAAKMRWGVPCDCSYCK